MKKRIFLGMCLVAVVAVVITALCTVVAVFEGNRQVLKEQLVVEADYVKTAYESQGLPYLQGLNTGIGGRITVIGPDGGVIYDSVADPQTLENHRNRQEVAEAFEKGSGSSSRYSDTLREETNYYAQRLDDGSVLRISATSGSVYAAMLDTLPWVVGIVLLATVVAMLLANVETRRIVGPVNAIDLDAPQENEVYDEFSPFLVRMEKQRCQIAQQIATLKQQQKDFAAIIENMREGLIVVDKKGDLLSYNRGAVRLCGCRADFEAGQSVFVMNRDIEFCRAVEDALAGKETQLQQKIDGRCCRFFVSPVAESAAGAVIVIMDVTEKENREELRREFTANVSHELKTPLTSISGYAEIMKNGMVKAGDIPGFAQRIYQEAQRLIALVSDIIKLSRLDESEGALRREHCDLMQIARTVALRLEPAAGAADVTLQALGDPAAVQGVSGMLEEMIYNLCDNAIKYNRPGGRVTAQTGCRGGRAFVTVCDTGIGIPEEDHDRIFERFYRVDKSHAKESGGTGLGLSIVKHCVLLHGGEIELESTAGVGTKISVYLPAEPACAPV